MRKSPAEERWPSNSAQSNYPWCFKRDWKYVQRFAFAFSNDVTCHSEERPALFSDAYGQNSSGASTDRRRLQGPVWAKSGRNPIIGDVQLHGATPASTAEDGVYSTLSRSLKRGRQMVDPSDVASGQLQKCQRTGQ